MQRPYLSLIIPAYNESGRVQKTLETVKAYLETTGHSYEIILVDDGSTDGTGALMRDSVADDDSIRVISYDKNRGKGYAVRQGVLAAHGEYIAFSDADLSAPIAELQKLFYSGIDKGYDIAIGSRAVKGAHITGHQPFYREIGGKTLNLVVRLLAVRGIHDTQCGFKLFRGDAARAIFEKCFLNGWGFDIEVLYLARRMGFTIAEVGVEWSHGEGSKLHPLQAGLQVLRDIVKMRLHSYPR